MVGFGINSAGFAKGLDDEVREGKRKQVGATAGPQWKARRQRGDSNLGAVEVVLPNELGLENQGFPLSFSHQVYVEWLVCF